MLSFCMKNWSHVILLNSEVMAALSDRCGLQQKSVARMFHTGTGKHYVAKLPHRLAERPISYFI